MRKVRSISQRERPPENIKIPIPKAEQTKGGKILADATMLTQDELKKITEIAAGVGAKTALEEYKKAQQEEKKKRVDRRMFNTKLLLRNYRDLKKYCEEIASESEAEEDDENIIDMLDREYLSLESIKKSKRRTLAMMQFIDNMLNIYKKECSRKGKLSYRTYETLHHFYIAEEKKTYTQIAELHEVHERTAQRDLQDAVHAMAILFFGIDGLRFLV